jgi:hypothetical protein
MTSGTAISEFLEFLGRPHNLSYYERAVRTYSEILMNASDTHHFNANRLSPATEQSAREAVENLRDWSGAVTEIHGWPEYARQRANERLAFL